MKATWKVTAGIIIGQPMDEYTKKFIYTSEMYESDQAGNQMFHSLMDQMQRYTANLTNPGLLNWVNTEFIWY